MRYTQNLGNLGGLAIEIEGNSFLIVAESNPIPDLYISISIRPRPIINKPDPGVFNPFEIIRYLLVLWCVKYVKILFPTGGEFKHSAAKLQHCTYQKYWISVSVSNRLPVSLAY
jgi:hypothetical protein